MELQQQRSKEWFEYRKGRFTGSEIYKLLIGGKRPMTEGELIAEKERKGKRATVDTLFGETALTYIFEKACEIVFGLDETEKFLTQDMQRGLELEPLAFRKFKELKELEFINVEECSFFAYGDNAGASPDGLVDKDAVYESKAPKPFKFFNIILKGAEAIDPEYMAQMQMEMLVTNSLRCHFFNYIIFNGVEMWHEIIVERDEVMIGNIKNRIIEASIIRDKYVDELKKNKQF